MTVDIRIGKLVRNPDAEESFYMVGWPDDILPKTDGSKHKFNRTAGFPYRSCSMTDFENWINYDPAFRQIFQIATGGAPDILLPSVTQINHTILYYAKKMHRPKLNPLQTDRSRWLLFWLEQSKQTFGQDAVISFS